MEGGWEIWPGQISQIISPERLAKEGISRRTRFNWKTENLGSELGKGMRVRDTGHQQCEHKGPVHM